MHCCVSQVHKWVTLHKAGYFNFSFALFYGLAELLPTCITTAYFFTFALKHHWHSERSRAELFADHSASSTGVPGEAENWAGGYPAENRGVAPLPSPLAPQWVLHVSPGSGHEVTPVLTEPLLAADFLRGGDGDSVPLGGVKDSALSFPMSGRKEDDSAFLLPGRRESASESENPLRLRGEARSGQYVHMPSSGDSDLKSLDLE